MSHAGIDWKLILKAFLAFLAAPWTCVYLLLLAIVPAEAPHFWQISTGAVLVGAAYLLTPAGAAYFAARYAKQRPIAHAFLAVAMCLVAYLSFFEESLFAVVVWPVMGMLGVLPVVREMRNSA